MMAPNIDSMVSLVYRYDFNMQIFQSISFNTSKFKKMIVSLFRRLQLYNPAQKNMPCDDKNIRVKLRALYRVARRHLTCSYIKEMNIIFVSCFWK